LFSWKERQMFLGWFDDTPKKATPVKIDEAIDCYRERFGRVPNLCLVNEQDQITHDEINVKVAKTVRPNNFWVGCDPLEAEVLPTVKVEKKKDRRTKAVA
jgi:hypothetical protein